MSSRGDLKDSLLQMLQAGMFEEMVGCQEGQCAQVEFQERTSYLIRLNRRTMVLEERETEVVRQKVDGRWERLGPPNVRTGRIILERGTRKILRSDPPRGIKRASRAVRRERSQQNGSMPIRPI